jgi:hypothetical protein
MQQMQIDSTSASGQQLQNGMSMQEQQAIPFATQSQFTSNSQASNQLHDPLQQQPWLGLFSSSSNGMSAPQQRQQPQQLMPMSGISTGSRDAGTSSSFGNLLGTAAVGSGEPATPIGSPMKGASSSATRSTAGSQWAATQNNL